MKRSAFDSPLARERAIDRLAADGEPIRRIAFMLRMTEKSVVAAIKRRSGLIHQQRVMWLRDVVKFAAAEGVDLTACAAFQQLHANITLFCIAHPEALVDEVDPDLGCRLCRHDRIRRRALPKAFPYRILVKWHEQQGTYIATAPKFESLSARGATISAARRELGITGLALLQELVQEGTALPPTDLGRAQRVGMKTAIEAIKDAKKPPKVQRRKTVKTKREADEKTEALPSVKPNSKQSKKTKGKVPVTPSGDEDWTGLDDEDLNQYDPELMPPDIRERYDATFST